MARPDTLRLEGRWAVEAAFRSEVVTLESVVLESDRYCDLALQLADEGIRVEYKSSREIVDVAGYQFHQGVYGLANRPELIPPSATFLASARKLVAPVGLADEGNLGTIIRSATAFGADGIILEANRGADVFSRKCMRSIASALFRVPIFEVEDLSRFLDQAKEAGLVSFGTCFDRGAPPLREVHPSERSLILFGNEGHGLKEGIRRGCDELLHVPTAGGADALNIAATAAIVLYELLGDE